MDSMTQSDKSNNKQKPSQQIKALEFQAIGTSWWLGIFEDVGSKRLASVEVKINSLIEDFDKSYSRFRPDSLVTDISKKAGTFKMPDSSYVLISMYQKLYESTDGLVTPLIGRVISDAGYDAEYSLKKRSLTKPKSWEEVLDFNNGKLSTNVPVLLDFGAVGKGYLVDLISDLLVKEGISRFCIDAGGDMLAKNTEPLRIGLENPDDTDQIIGVVKLKDRAICGSAGNRRAWGDFHHIINPETLKPVKNIKAVWVVAKDAMTADGLSTALFFVGPEKLSDFKFEYLLINDKNQLQYSQGFPAELFT